ncbi:hypothetical protein McanCB49686_001346 [Microsporum canis]
MVRHQTTAMTSDSSGEISAVYAVGLLSFREALGVAYYRGELARKYQRPFPLTGGVLGAGIRLEASLRSTLPILQMTVI